MRVGINALYDHWLGAWDMALVAVATANESGALSAHDAAVHRAVIVVERELVTQQLTLLRGRARPTEVGDGNRRPVRVRMRLSDDVRSPAEP
jgi:hypothetical protein